MGASFETRRESRRGERSITSALRKTVAKPVAEANVALDFTSYDSFTAIAGPGEGPSVRAKEQVGESFLLQPRVRYTTCTYVHPVLES